MGGHSVQIQGPQNTFSLAIINLKPHSLTLTSPGSRGHHQHLQRGRQLTPLADHPPPKAYGSRALGYAPTRVTSILHPRAFPTPTTLFRPIPIKRRRTNSIFRGLGRLTHCALTICHLLKVAAIRASEAHPRHRWIPETHPFTSHPVPFPHFPSCKRIPWVP